MQTNSVEAGVGNVIDENKRLIPIGRYCVSSELFSSGKRRILLLSTKEIMVYNGE